MKARRSRLAPFALLPLTLAALGAALTVRPSRAQESGRSAAGERRPPALLVKTDESKGSEPLRIADARVEVTILGHVASTRLELTFQNDLPRVLEGQLVLPLPPDATISSFALEIDGKMRPASVVEREKARVVFEEVVRRGIDPGLVEWTKGNNFTTRVYPIPAKGTKKVVLGWDEPLARDASGKATYFLPLGLKGLDSFETLIRRACAAKVTLLGAQPVEVPHIREVGPTNPTRFAPAGPKIDSGDVRIEVAPAAGADVLVEPTRVKAAVGKTPELCWVATVPVPGIPSARVLPKRVTVLWDASGSAAGRDRAKERAFLEQYLSVLGDAEARLVAFSNDVWEGERTFAVKEGKSAELLAATFAIRPDGGTRFQCLDLAKLGANADAFLLFTDGLATFGTDGLPKFGDKPVTCIASGASLDVGCLDRLARGGALVNLNTTSPTDGVARALEPPLVVLGIDEDFGPPSEKPNGTAHEIRVDEVFPAAGTRVSGATLAVTGRLTRGKPVSIAVRFGRGGAEVAKATFTLDPDSGTETGLVERIWAGRKVDSLLANAARNESEIVAVGKAHGLVTPFTSLLVLDRVEDYVRYHVTPPAEMRDEWEKRIEAEKTAATKDRETLLASVRERWKARVEWWKKTFTYDAGFKFLDPAKAQGEAAPVGTASAGFSGGNGPAGAPRPAPAPEALDALRRSGGRPSAQAARELAQADDATGAEKKMKAGVGGGEDGPPAITLKPWDPKTPYLEAIKKADAAARYATYLDQKASWGQSTAFFLDCADFFYAEKQPALALRVLSNVAELKIESAPLARILGYRLAQQGEIDLAIEVFENVTRLKPEEPQSWRDLGLAHAQAKHYEQAVQNLEKVVLGKWDGRFPDIEIIALGELNRVIADWGPISNRQGPLTTLPSDLIANLDCDLRVILTWDADACDMDLWVTEPSGEKAFYGHTATTIGGAFGKDFTQGYGPEEYMVKKAMPGKYKIEINYYGNHQQIIAGATTVQILAIKNYGRPNEERVAVTRRLQDNKEVLEICDVDFQKK